ncbi:uncharacterized protein LOC128745650 [Sabethes cyaneus]|uniref:uncharacterized protein LOC128745650 n=1 Tax=Sabethes cyaneus TaxID=53552 RepID=UPI00237ED55B|nr:uncharacterized protein LOC128745650 [Sabethes cyaneus]
MDTQISDANVFDRKEKLCRSPILKEVVAQMFSGNTQQQITPKGQGSMLNFTTPIPKSKEDSQQTNKLRAAKEKLLKLIEFMKERSNIHGEIKKQAARTLTAVIEAEMEQEALIKRVVVAEEALAEKEVVHAALIRRAVIAEEALAATILDQAVSRAPRTEKRDRESPGDKVSSKKRKDELNGDHEEQNENRAEEQCDTEQGEASGWRTIPKQKEESENKKKMKEDRQKQLQRDMPAEREEAEKKAKNRARPQPRRIRSRGDALIVGVKGEKMTYADLLKRMRDDPKLKELGEKVVKTRRTQSGELLFELKRDPEVKSAAFKALVETALGSEAQVKALSQETIVEAKNLDEVTTESEVKAVLTRAEYLGDVPMSIRLRKAYDSTQTASIRLPIEAANRLLKVDRVKIGWAVVSFRAIPREPKEMARCFKCMDFGHQARNCPGPDRSKLCRKCGNEGHVVKDCNKQPRCMLCKEDNDHVTGGFKCLVYQKAKAALQ